MDTLCLPGKINVKNKALFYIFVFPALLVACGAALDDSDAFVPGSYTGSVISYGGTLSVTATFSANAVTGVKIIEHHDSSSRPQVQQALIDIPQTIAELNSFDVEVISGASVTSRRIMDAAEECAEQARLVPHGAGTENRWRFINNSGYTFNVTTSGVMFELKPGGNHAVLASSIEPSFTLSGVFYNVSPQKSPGLIIFVNE
jgi:major membrane immunogen (membrane-anchored lipoprotein)